MINQIVLTVYVRCVLSLPCCLVYKEERRVDIASISSFCPLRILEIFATHILYSSSERARSLEGGNYSAEISIIQLLLIFSELT